jgi:hypothetical protein
MATKATTTKAKTATTTTTAAPRGARAAKSPTDPVQDENLNPNDTPAEAPTARAVTGDASADANPDADSAVDKARAKNRSVPTAEKTPEKPAKGVAVPVQEPSGTLDAAERERENAEFKANTPPDRTPDKTEQRINEEVGAMTSGSPQPTPMAGAGQEIAADEVGNLAGRADEGSAAAAPPSRDLEARLERDRDAKRTPHQDKLDDAADARGGEAPEPAAKSEGGGDDGTTYRRRLHDSASGTSVDRFRQEVLAQARESGRRVVRLQEKITPPLHQASIDGQRDYELTPIFGD